ncbi:CCE_0567 family metalloprotein [Marinospirillum perlucidum]|uniref:CCE_0567 family metalloprotein n=1 Tax=Marinospirillum perlucidum TaxID=1982602 RepID=UPI000DF22194|nr:CCE_0567 family metalloprotein [Marinospirillum perlucidum]
MTPEELKKLEKEVRKAKRRASEAAMELHDLVEDALPGAYQQLPEIAEKTYAACKAWDTSRQELEKAQEEA